MELPLFHLEEEDILANLKAILEDGKLALQYKGRLFRLAVGRTIWTKSSMMH